MAEGPLIKRGDLLVGFGRDGSRPRSGLPLREIRPAVLVANESQHPRRCRFTLAHGRRHRDICARSAARSARRPRPHARPPRPSAAPHAGRIEVRGGGAGRAHWVVLMQLLDQVRLAVTAETGWNDRRIVGLDCLDYPVHRCVAGEEEHRSLARLQRSSDASTAAPASGSRNSRPRSIPRALRRRSVACPVAARLTDWCSPTLLSAVRSTQRVVDPRSKP
jgi:hypothetical protein